MNIIVMLLIPLAIGVVFTSIIRYLAWRERTQLSRDVDKFLKPRCIKMPPKSGKGDLE